MVTGYFLGLKNHVVRPVSVYQEEGGVILTVSNQNVMNVKLNPIEVARFLICVGIAWIAWMTQHHTGTIF